MADDAVEKIMLLGSQHQASGIRERAAILPKCCWAASYGKLAGMQCLARTAAMTDTQ